MRLLFDNLDKSQDATTPQQQHLLMLAMRHRLHTKKPPKITLRGPLGSPKPGYIRRSNDAPRTTRHRIAIYMWPAVRRQRDGVISCEAQTATSKMTGTARQAARRMHESRSVLRQLANMRLELGSGSALQYSFRSLFCLCYKNRCASGDDLHEVASAISVSNFHRPSRSRPGLGMLGCAKGVRPACML
jgi:hypothetical protein